MHFGVILTFQNASPELDKRVLKTSAGYDRCVLDTAASNDNGTQWNLIPLFIRDINAYALYSDAYNGGNNQYLMWNPDGTVTYSPERNAQTQWEISPLGPATKIRAFSNELPEQLYLQGSEDGVTLKNDAESDQSHWMVDIHHVRVQIQFRNQGLFETMTYVWPQAYAGPVAPGGSSNPVVTQLPPTLEINYQYFIGGIYNGFNWYTWTPKTDSSGNPDGTYQVESPGGALPEQDVSFGGLVIVGTTEIEISPTA